MNLAVFRPKLQNPSEGRKAESRGICHNCLRIIEVGDLFRWLPGVPPAPAHLNCKHPTKKANYLG